MIRICGTDYTDLEVEALCETVKDSPALQVLMRDNMVHVACRELGPNEPCAEPNNPEWSEAACVLARLAINAPAGQLERLKS